MRALVVYESMYGNTQAIAEAVTDGLAARCAAGIVEVSDAPRELSDVDLLVVGAPTHAFGLSRASTRASAAERSTRPIISTGEGVREWLEAVEAPVGLLAAAFDTHVDTRVPGSAAAAARRRLRRRGMRIVAEPESFYVDDMEGPLLAGELDRARDWGVRIAEASVMASA